MSEIVPWMIIEISEEEALELGYYEAMAREIAEKDEEKIWMDY